jgi:hypothetical protein
MRDSSTLIPHGNDTGILFPALLGSQHIEVGNKANNYNEINSRCLDEKMMEPMVANWSVI